MSASLFEGAANEIDLKTSDFFVEVNTAADVMHCGVTGATLTGRNYRLWVADFRSQALPRDFVSRCNDNSSLDCVFEFAHIAWPGIRLQQRENFRGYLFGNSPGILFVVLTNEVLHERQYIFAAIAQRRQFNGNN